MTEARSGGGTGSRGNPPPRRALSRFSPLAADESSVSATGGGGTGDAGAVSDAGAASEVGVPSPAAAPGGTEGRDLLIPGSAPKPPRAQPPTNGKNGRGVPSLADLMPPAAPSGRRHGGHHGHHRGHSAPDSTLTRDVSATKGAKSAKDEKTVEISVRLRKPVRKQLKARATELGLTPEETVTRLVEVWLEG